MKNILICLDRDGTLIYDDRYYLGRTSDWKSKVKILKNVIRGLELIKKEIPGAVVYMITNQPGVAIKDFPQLTLKRDHEVNRYVLKKINEKKDLIKDYIFCPYASKDYPKTHLQYDFKKEYVKNKPCIKPLPGMIYQALKKEGFNKKNTKIYFIGDRDSDVKTALNAGGIGILIPFSKTKEELRKVRQTMKNKNLKKRINISKDLLSAAKFIARKEKSKASSSEHKAQFLDYLTCRQSCRN